MEKFAEITMVSLHTMVITFTGAEATPENFEDYLDEVTEAIARYPGLVMVYDGSEMPLIPSQFRIRHGKWIQEKRTLLESNVEASALIVPNILTRMVMKGVFLIQKPVTPYKVVDSRDEANVYLAQFVPSMAS